MPIKNLLKVGLAGAAFLAFSVTGAISAPNIPCGTAKLIVPWGAGGGTDIIFRQIVEKVNKSGAKPQLQVVNVGGQGGNKGAKQAAKAKPDGCTLFAIHQSAITSYFTGRIDITWDAFEPVSMMTSTPSIIGANVNVPYSNLTELVEAAKKAPGEITAGGTFGSTSQFVFLLLEDAAGVKFKHVSYDGTKQRMTALLADNIKLGEINLAAAIKYIKEGKLKALGVTNPARLDQIPDMKTAQEQGYDLIYAVERGIVAPKGTSQEIIDHYASLLKDAAADSGFKDAMHKKGILITYKNASDYRDHFQATYDKWLPIAKKVGVYKRK
jgi:tripartite-type tricarboxylate transporter receptor subunit TctC